MIISSLLVFAAVYVYRKSKFSRASALVFVILCLTTMGLDLLYEISDYFTGNGITDATIYQMRYGFGGVGFMVYREVLIAVGLFLAIMGILLWVVFMVYSDKNGAKSYFYVAFFLVSGALCFSPAVPDLYRFSVLAIGNKDVSISSDGYNFYDYYKDPIIRQTGKKKNLVFIYGESLEQTYSNKSAFPGLTNGLNDLTEKSIFFTNLHQTYGANYTIAGFVASQCGIPLVGPAYGNSMSGMDSYLPSTVCLGDLLKKEEYHLVYYGGADTDFAGKGLFLGTHGFDEIRGLRELSPMLGTPVYKNNWGLYDDSLFDISYARFLELSRSREPFGLFMLTLDTHQPDGSISESCKNIRYEDGSNPIFDAVACSDYLITKFVDKILMSPYAEDTVVVVASDHLAPHDPTKSLPSAVKRSNRLMIFSSDIVVPREIKSLGSTLDTGSTVLSFIGYEGVIGLGRDLLNPNQSVSEIEVIQQHISQWIAPLSHFWNFPKITDSIEIDIPGKTVLIEGRRFKIPVLVELDSDLQSTLKFQFDLEFDTSDKKAERDLISLIQKSHEDTPFLLIDQCDAIGKIAEGGNKTGFCLLSGKGSAYSVMSLTGIRRFTVEEILDLTGLASIH